ncbi:hypothetical protein OHB49_23155 [Streptomyces sp. NBC_01717]|uniref:hypothetical protein n=1 Tax=Streptomyces sp. NBC_01717 TaxID=2975918 RepID=UPI002E336064|nr:hypothetical protein [Streptomyces sp. NBC_01717]
MTEQTAAPIAATEEPTAPEQELPPTGAEPAAAAEPVPATEPVTATEPIAATEPAPATVVPATEPAPATVVPATEPAAVTEPLVAPDQAPAVAEPVPASKSSRRVLRAVARWTAAVLVLGGLGTGTALGITSMERTDVPGLATEGDGRWDYPELSLPALPAGSPRPFNEANVAEIHHADLRKLLIPAPAGATADKKLTGDWVSTAQFVGEFRKDKRGELTQLLDDSALRHIAARGWTMPDGTRSRVYLLQFNSTAYAQGLRDDTYVSSTPGIPLDWPTDLQLDESWNAGGKVPETVVYAFGETKTGKGRIHEAYIQAGDTLALVIHSQQGKKIAEQIPFRQTLILQNQLLG